MTDQPPQPADRRTPPGAPSPSMSRAAAGDSPQDLAQAVAPGELAAVLARVDLGEVLLVSPVALGRPDSPKSLLRTARGLFLVRRLTPRPDLAHRTAINLAVSQRLRDAGLRVPRVIEPLRPGERDTGPLIGAAGRLFEVREFIPARACEPTHADAARLGHAAARVHAALQRFNPHLPVPAWRLQPPDSLRARLNPGPGVDRAAAANFARIADLASLAATTLASLAIADSEFQLIHGDLHPGNVVFTGVAGDEPVILDVESAQLGPPIADLASAALHVWLRARPADNPARPPGVNSSSSVGFHATAALFNGYHSRCEQRTSPALARAAPWLMIHAAACEIADASFSKQDRPAVLGLVAVVRRALDEMLDRAGAISALAHAAR